MCHVRNYENTNLITFDLGSKKNIYSMSYRQLIKRDPETNSVGRATILSMPFDAAFAVYQQMSDFYERAH